jgi:hypothetical protein
VISIAPSSGGEDRPWAVPARLPHVSTLDQDLTLQLDALQAVSYAGLSEEKALGAQQERAQLMVNPGLHAPGRHAGGV